MRAAMRKMLRSFRRHSGTGGGLGGGSKWTKVTTTGIITAAATRSGELDSRRQRTATIRAKGGPPPKCDTRERGASQGSSVWRGEKPKGATGMKARLTMMATDVAKREKNNNSDLYHHVGMPPGLNQPIPIWHCDSTLGVGGQRRWWNSHEESTQPRS